MGDTGINLRGIPRIKNGILRYGKGLGRVYIGRKMKIVILESMNCLVMLRRIWRIENAGIFLCDGDSVPQVDLHGSLEPEKKVISASGGAVDSVIVVVKSIVFTEIQLVHVLHIPFRLFFSLPYHRKKSQTKRRK